MILADSSQAKQLADTEHFAIVAYTPTYVTGLFHPRTVSHRPAQTETVCATIAPQLQSSAQNHRHRAP